MKESDDVINICSGRGRVRLGLSSLEGSRRAQHCRLERLSINVAVAHYVVVTVAVAVASHEEMEGGREKDLVVPSSYKRQVKPKNISAKKSERDIKKWFRRGIKCLEID